MKDLVYDYFQSYIDQLNVEPQLKKAMSYSFISNGKLIRPLVFFTFLKEFNVKPENYINIACAIEMIHTYSLIHDDLPAMDDDNYRRGRLTTHKKYGEDIAILTGDALLTHAFDILIDNELLTDNQKVQLVKNTVDCCGANAGMINGQILDINNYQKILSTNDLEQIHIQKTSRMLQLPVICSLIVSNNLKLVDKLNILMKNLGLLYQVRDDYLDFYSSDNLGKDKQSDLKNEKYTFVNKFNDEQKLLDYMNDLKKECFEIIDDYNLSNEIKELVILFGEREQ